MTKKKPSVRRSMHTCAICSGQYAEVNITNTELWLCSKDYNNFSNARDKAHKNHDECTPEEAKAWASQYIHRQMISSLGKTENYAPGHNESWLDKL